MSGTLTIKLKQHSPLIHYQGKQPGAFLSAGALKAAIDHEMDNGRIDGVRKKIIYSLDVEPTGNVTKKDYGTALPHNTLYFGDMGQGRVPSKLLYTNNLIDLKIGEYRSKVSPGTGEQPWDENLFRKCLKKTLAFNNFGKRGTKGFGCFWLAEDESLEDYLCNNLDNEAFYYKIPVKLQEFNPALTNNKDPWVLYRLCFELIDIFTRRLKAGINLPNINQKTDPKASPRLYCKSLLSRYLAEVKKEEWDKKRLKDVFINRNDPDPARDIMYRFRLGAAPKHEYRNKEHNAYGYPPHGGFDIIYEVVSGQSNLVEEIQRIPSPYLFKIDYQSPLDADILIFVDPFVKTSEYRKLNDIAFKATAKFGSRQADMTLNLAAMDENYLNALLHYAKVNFDRDVAYNPRDHMADDIWKRMHYIKQHIEEYQIVEEA
jgi:hypothetical protein